MPLMPRDLNSGENSVERLIVLTGLGQYLDGLPVSIFSEKEQKKIKDFKKYISELELNSIVGIIDKN